LYRTYGAGLLLILNILPMFGPYGAANRKSLLIIDKPSKLALSIPKPKTPLGVERW